LILAFLSGYFTVVFYAESQTGWNMWVLGGLAGMLEFIKIMLAIAYPFIKQRDATLEKKVSFYLKICFFLSIMASLNFFMSGGDIERSPASTITQLLYNYMPILNIIPVKFSQFITTMSLSVLVEAFIIFLPMLAPIMFFDKDINKKVIATTNIDKLKEIVKVIPERLIDNLYEKIVKDSEREKIIATELKPKKTQLKLLKPKLQIETNNYNNTDLEHLTKIIFENEREGKCPSITFLTDESKFTRAQITELKKELNNLGITKTEGTTTFLSTTEEKALEILKNGGNQNDFIYK